MAQQYNDLELEWLAVTNSLKSYIEHPEEHTATIFMKCKLSKETIERLRVEKNLCVDDSFGSFHMVRRAPGNTDDALAKLPV